MDLIFTPSGHSNNLKSEIIALLWKIINGPRFIRELVTAYCIWILKLLNKKTHLNKRNKYTFWEPQKSVRFCRCPLDGAINPQT